MNIMPSYYSVESNEANGADNLLMECTSVMKYGESISTKKSTTCLTDRKAHGSNETCQGESCKATHSSILHLCDTLAPYK